MVGQPSILFLKDTGIVTFDWVAVGVVLTILLYRIDKE